MAEPYRFTRRWFKLRNEAAFEKRVKPEWAGKPITYLEVGVFEGMSLVWMLENVLTHEQSRAVGIDPWLMTIKLSARQMQAKYRNAKHNLLHPSRPWHGRCDLIRGSSAEVLRRMMRRGCAGIGPESVDLAMIDGGHFASQVFDDAKSILPLIKVGGWIIFDDVRNAIRKKDHVADGLKWFLDQAEGQVERIWKSTFMSTYRRVR